MSSPKPVRIYSWNINGIRSATQKGFAEWLKKSRAEIVGVQEVRAQPGQVPPEVSAVTRFQQAFTAPERKGYSGVGLFSRRKPDALETSLGENRFDAEGRVQIARFGRLVVANGYFPNGSGKDRDNSRIPYKLDWYAALFDRLQKLRKSGKRVIVMGDSVSFLPTSANHPRQLEHLLGKRGFAVETLNAAVPGFASHNLRALFESEVSKYDADIFVLSVGWNDLGQFGPEGLPYKRYQAGYEVSALQRVLSGIYLVRAPYALVRFLRRFEPAFDAPLSEADVRLYDAYVPQHYYENLSAVLELAKQRYPRVFVTNLATLTSEDPSRYQLETAHFPVGMDKNMRKLHRVVLRYNETVERVAREQGVPIIDLYSVFQDDEARRTMRDSCHVNAEGAELIAAAVLDGLETSLPRAPDASLAPSR